MKQFLIIILLLSSISSFSQENKLIKTSEYVEEKKRRDMFYNSNMSLIKEVYYNVNGQMTNEITYDSSENIIRFKSFDNLELKLDVDFKNGDYFFPERNLKLKFKGNFIFDGLQQGNNIIVNYLNGKKNGVLIQTDSAVSGKKIVQTQKLDVRLLKFNIFKYYNDSYLDDDYQLFKGVKLNFNNNLLNGKQYSYYINGKIKFNSIYNKGVLVNHESFDNNGNILSKINSDSSYAVSKPVIRNGTVFKYKDSIILLNEVLNQTGDIVRENLFNQKWNLENVYKDPFIKLIENSDLELVDYLSPQDANNYGVVAINNSKDLKKRFDENKYPIKDGNTLRLIFSIPLFDLKRYDFNKEEDFVEIPKIKSVNNSVIEKYVEKLYSFDRSYKLVFENIKFQMDPYTNQYDPNDGYRTRNLSMLPGYPKDTKKYFHSIIRRSLFNITQFQNTLNNYIDPYETDLFGFRYKHSKLRINYSYEEMNGQNNPSSGSIDEKREINNQRDYAIVVSGDEIDSSRNHFFIFREHQIWFFDNTNKKNYMQYFDDDDKTIIVREFDINNNGDIVFNEEYNKGNSFILGNLEVALNDFPNKMSWEEANLACNSLGSRWRLPNSEELNILYENRTSIGLSAESYWSSTEDVNQPKQFWYTSSPSSAWAYSFSNGISGFVPKKMDGSVRAVRTF